MLLPLEYFFFLLSGLIGADFDSTTVLSNSLESTDRGVSVNDVSADDITTLLLFVLSFGSS
jgi:uncharacterized protein involved in cysteine biosynthesis